jgi:hypothetical protein
MQPSTTKAPAPRVGMRIVDVAFPRVPWTIVQCDGQGAPIYLRRDHDGRLFHHDATSWARAWRCGYIELANGRKS